MRIWPKIKGIHFNFTAQNTHRNQIEADYNVEKQKLKKKTYSTEHTENKKKKVEGKKKVKLEK